MPLSTAELSLIEQRVTNDGPSTGVAYLFWLFLWFVSAHRFYLGRPGTAILQILSYFILVGFVWVVVDAFLIPGMIRERRNEIRQKIALQLGADYRPAMA
jgi:TM2 domain-containing membrane protein YozV